MTQFHKSQQRAGVKEAGQYENRFEACARESIMKTLDDVRALLNERRGADAQKVGLFHAQASCEQGWEKDLLDTCRQSMAETVALLILEDEPPNDDDPDLKRRNLLREMLRKALPERTTGAAFTSIRHRLRVQRHNQGGIGWSVCRGRLVAAVISQCDAV